jgi:hypothetical protein
MYILFWWHNSHVYTTCLIKLRAAFERLLSGARVGCMGDIARTKVSNGHAQKAYVFTLDRYMYVRICLKRRADDTLLQVFLVFTDFHSGTYSDPFRFPTKNLYLKMKYNLNVTKKKYFLKKNEKVSLRKRQTIFVDLSAILIKVMWHQLTQEYAPHQPRVYSCCSCARKSTRVNPLERSQGVANLEVHQRLLDRLVALISQNTTDRYRFLLFSLRLFHSFIIFTP